MKEPNEENQNELNTPKKSTSFWQTVKEYGFLILIAFLIAMSVKLVFEPTKVSGISMYPTLEDEDRIALNRFELWFGEVDRNDIVVFDWKEGNRFLIKRVIGVEGDKIKINEEGVFLNGQKLDEKYINPEEPMLLKKEIDVTVPENHYFVMGDNRNHSSDSREDIIGFIEEEDILGTYLTRYIPFKSLDENHKD